MNEFSTLPPVAMPPIVVPTPVPIEAPRLVATSPAPLTESITGPRAEAPSAPKPPIAAPLSTPSKSCPIAAEAMPERSAPMPTCERRLADALDNPAEAAVAAAAVLTAATFAAVLARAPGARLPASAAIAPAPPGAADAPATPAPAPPPAEADSAAMPPPTAAMTPAA